MMVARYEMEAKWMSALTNVTRLLNLFARGLPVDREQFAATVYEELRAIAARHMAGERRGHTLQATALVNDAYLRLVGDPAYWLSLTFTAFALNASRSARSPNRPNTFRRARSKPGTLRRALRAALSAGCSHARGLIWVSMRRWTPFSPFISCSCRFVARV